MKTLYILRHAKSSWDNASLADHDRPLNDRGELAAAFMGRLMKAQAYRPSIVISSPAERALRTAQLVIESAEFHTELVLDRRIYEASPHRLVETITSIDPVHKSAMIVGHNPGLEGLIQYLSRQLEPLPTAALAVLTLQITSWADVTDFCGTVERVHRPRDEMSKIAG